MLRTVDNPQQLTGEDNHFCGIFWRVAQALAFVVRILLEHSHLIFRVPQPFALFAKGAGFGPGRAQNLLASLEKHGRRDLEPFAQSLDVGLVEGAFLVQDFGNDTFGTKD